VFKFQVCVTSLSTARYMLHGNGPKHSIQIHLAAECCDFDVSYSADPMCVCAVMHMVIVGVYIVR